MKKIKNKNSLLQHIIDSDKQGNGFDINEEVEVACEEDVGEGEPEPKRRV